MIMPIMQMLRRYVQVCGPMEVSGVLAVQELAQDLVVKWGEANVHRQKLCICDDYCNVVMRLLVIMTVMENLSYYVYDGSDEKTC